MLCIQYSVKADVKDMKDSYQLKLIQLIYGERMLYAATQLFEAANHIRSTD